jgi:thioredoxin 1
MTVYEYNHEDCTFAWPTEYVVDYYSTTCQPCAQIAKLLPKWSNDSGIPVVKVDVDKYPNAATVDKVRKVPTFIYRVAGKEKGRIVGVPRLSELTAMVTEN